jgi:putative glutamine amidotransferase
MVNSSHHQAVGKIGKGLRVAATAPDGIIEAIESINHKFVIGVEWHPEYLNPNDLDLNLFKGLIEAIAKLERF